MGRLAPGGGLEGGPAGGWRPGVCGRGSERLFCVRSLAGLLLRLCRLLPVLRLLPQDPTVPEHALHVRALLHPRRPALLRHDVQDRG